MTLQQFLLEALRGLTRFALWAAIFLGKVMLWLIPTGAALAALMGFFAWVLGIPGSSTQDYYVPWLTGLVVLGGYLGAYGAYLVFALAGVFLKRPKTYYAATATIWVCMIAAFLIMPGVWTSLLGD